MDETLIKYSVGSVCVAQLVDQNHTSIWFHTAYDSFIAPTGPKRVGSNSNADDKKKGVTLVAAFKMASSRMVKPFTMESVVLGGIRMAA